MLNRIIEIEREVSFLNGKWDENEYDRVDLTLTKYRYLLNQCHILNFDYHINWEVIENTAIEWGETLITSQDLRNNNINEDNLWQFDRLCTNIKVQLINFLKRKFYKEE